MLIMVLSKSIMDPFKLCLFKMPKVGSSVAQFCCLIIITVIIIKYDSISLKLDTSLINLNIEMKKGKDNDEKKNN